MRRGRIESQLAKEIDKRKIGSVGNTDERVDGVGENVVEEMYRHRNAGSGEGNENQMRRKGDEWRGVEEK